MRAQRLLTDRGALAPEFDRRRPVAGVPHQRHAPCRPSPDYAAHAANRFADWRLVVDGLVARPLALSLAQIGTMPTRTQITRHDCVEGWSAIGKWTGVPLKLLLDQARAARRRALHRVPLRRRLRRRRRYYESIDLIDAFHPQTILAWALNGQLLPVGNGAPLRLRVERQLGYKQAKYVERIEAVASLAGDRRRQGRLLGGWQRL